MVDISLIHYRMYIVWSPFPSTSSMMILKTMMQSLPVHETVSTPEVPTNRASIRGNGRMLCLTALTTNPCTTNWCRAFGRHGSHREPCAVKADRERDEEGKRKLAKDRSLASLIDRSTVVSLANLAGDFVLHVSGSMSMCLPP